MAYRVGQVLYVVISKKMQVYPMMIVEEITKRTLQGEQTNYVLQGGFDSDSTILLSQVDGEVFETPDEAKYVLTSRATVQIEKIVDSAVAKAAEWYPSQPERVVNEDVMTIQSSSGDDDAVRVKLPDGTIANLKTVGMVG